MLSVRPRYPKLSSTSFISPHLLVRILSNFHATNMRVIVEHECEYMLNPHVLESLKKKKNPKKNNVFRKKFFRGAGGAVQVNLFGINELLFFLYNLFGLKL